MASHLVRASRLYLGDNLAVMKRLLDECGTCVDLCYIDPPFNSARTYEAANKTVFKDIWTQVDEKAPMRELKARKATALCAYLTFIGERYPKAYLAYLATIALRLHYIHALLKDTGSLYLHCDATMSPYLRTLCDLIWGVAQYRNELIWYYTNKIPNTHKRVFTRSHDVILFYVKSIDGNYTYHIQEEARATPAKFTRIERRKGRKVAVRGKDGKVMTFTRDKRVVDSVWQFPMLVNQKEYMGYPTQKPIALLSRMVQASTNEGDVVADFFCGSGTTLDAAQGLNRRWIGADINPLALNFAKERLFKRYGEALEYEEHHLIKAHDAPPLSHTDTP